MNDDINPRARQPDSPGPRADAFRSAEKLTCSELRRGTSGYR